MTGVNARQKKARNRLRSFEGRDLTATEVKEIAGYAKSTNIYDIKNLPIRFNKRTEKYTVDMFCYSGRYIKY